MSDPATDMLFDNFTNAPEGSQYTSTQWGAPVWGNNGGISDGVGGIKPGTAGYQQDADRYRSMGAAAASRGAVQTDYSQANAANARGANALQVSNLDRYNGGMSRGQQQSALGMLQQSATGNGPSQAAAMSRGVTDRGLQGALTASAGARGGLANQAAAQQQALYGLQANQQAGIGQLASMRAGEMGDAREAYNHGGFSMRQGDYTQGAADLADADAYGVLGANQSAQAQQQAALEMQQHQLNQQAQQYYEQMGFNVNNAQLQANMQETSQDYGDYNFKANLSQQETADALGRATAFGGASAAFGASMINSGNAYPSHSGGGGGGGASPYGEGNYDVGGGGGGGNYGGYDAGYGGELGDYETGGGDDYSYAAEGGPIQAGKPYIVGERGPEMVIPHGDATVIPADRTPQVLAMYEPPGQQLQQGLGPSGGGYLMSADDDDGRPRIASRGHGDAHDAPQMRPSPVQSASPAQAARKKLTPDELRAAADKMEREMRAEHESRMAQGPAVSVEPAPSMGQVAYFMGDQGGY
jgi:hypothetical protein